MGFGVDSTQSTKHKWNTKTMKTMKNKRIILIVAVVLLLAMTATTLYGCNLFGFGLLGEADLISVMSDLAVSMFTGDGLSINILLENPEALGLFDQPAHLPMPIFDKATYEANMASLSKIVNAFKRFDYNKLSVVGKRDYDTVVNYFNTYSKYGNFYYLDNRDYIGVNDGWNVMIPLYLDKLAFKTENDVKNWISLAEQTETAFKEYARFEEEVLIANGYGRTKSTYLDIAVQCDLMAEVDEDSGEHFLLTLFKEKLEKVDFLTNEQKAEYTLKADDAIDKLILAYQTLAYDMNRMSVLAFEESKPLSAYQEGKAYYELLFLDKASTSDSVDMAYENLKAAFNETLAEARALQAQLPDGFTLEPKMSMEDLKGYYNILKSKYTEDFPTLSENIPDATFHTVPEAMSEFYNPAAYFKSAVDSTSAPETIYVNEDNTGGYLGFDIISHEGIPGHMLQHAYFKSSGANMLRTLLAYTGYAEGWASYVQYYSTKYYEGSETEKLAYEAESLFTKATMYLYTLIDIEINYYGRTKEYLSTHEVYSLIFSDNMYEYMIANPAVYSSYGYGNYKMEALRDAFEGTDLEFHTAVLTVGPTTYEILAKYI